MTKNTRFNFKPVIFTMVAIYNFYQQTYALDLYTSFFVILYHVSLRNVTRAYVYVWLCMKDHQHQQEGRKEKINENDLNGRKRETALGLEGRMDREKRSDQTCMKKASSLQQLANIFASRMKAPRVNRCEVLARLVAVYIRRCKRILESVRLHENASLSRFAFLHQHAEQTRCSSYARCFFFQFQKVANKKYYERVASEHASDAFRRVQYARSSLQSIKPTFVRPFLFRPFHSFPTSFVSSAAFSAAAVAKRLTTPREEIYRQTLCSPRGIKRRVTHGRQSVAWRPADMGLMQVIGSEAKINCARRS